MWYVLVDARGVSVYVALTSPESWKVPRSTLSGGLGKVKQHSEHAVTESLPVKTDGRRPHFSFCCTLFLSNEDLS